MKKHNYMNCDNNMINLRLKELMEIKKIGQRELSRETGIRQGTVGSYMNNTFKMINREHLDILCDYFQCNIADIFYKR